MEQTLSQNQISRPKPVVLIILDGWGIAPFLEGNAIALAKTPSMDYLWCHYPHTVLQAAGDAVGLPWGEVGNSEVGHLNIGAGRIIYEMLPRIERAISDGSFFQNQEFLAATEHVKKNNSRLHLMGIFSAGGVHGHIEHLFALLRLCKQQNIKNVCVHLFTDGRDAPPEGTPLFLEKLREKEAELEISLRICSIIGRYWAMDRDQRWDRTRMAYTLLTEAKGEIFASPEEAVKASYAKGETDEFIKPVVIATPDAPAVTINDGDAVIFWNFRPDRARQLALAFLAPEFEKFERSKIFRNLYFVTMADYELKLPDLHIAFPPVEIHNTLAEIISQQGLKQLHIAETEKYAHVTYFFNGGKEEPVVGEDRELIPSPKVSTYDQAPEMSARKIAEEVQKRINQNIYDFIVLNFANPDMVSHSGNLLATKSAIELCDQLVGQITNSAIRAGGMVFITGDHGNAEQMLQAETGKMDTEHSAYPVPFIAVHPSLAKPEGALCPPAQGPEAPQPSGVLADVAPTILEFMGITQPPEMTGISLRASLE